VKLRVTNVDHRTIIAGLTSAERVRLLARSDVAGLAHLTGHLGAIAASTVMILRGGALTPVFMLTQGVLIVFLFTLLHETVHRTPFRSRWLNDAAGRVCGLAVFMGPQWFRHFHLAHHRYTNEPGRDPELAGPRPITWWQYLRHLSGLPETLGRLRGLVRNATVRNEDDFVPEDRKRYIKREARVHLGIYAALLAISVVLGSTVLLLVWLIPMLVGGPFLRAYLLAEHAGCPDRFSMLENTRTTFTNPVVRFIAWNMPYHVEHHTYPAVPFYRLREFHQYTKDHIGVADNGYWRFNRNYVRSFRR
jgi:fatty acid desaturase